MFRQKERISHGVVSIYKHGGRGYYTLDSYHGIHHELPGPEAGTSMVPINEDLAIPTGDWAARWPDQIRETCPHVSFVMTGWRNCRTSSELEDGACSLLSIRGPNNELFTARTKDTTL